MPIPILNIRGFQDGVALSTPGPPEEDVQVAMDSENRRVSSPQGNDSEGQDDHAQPYADEEAAREYIYVMKKCIKANKLLERIIRDSQLISERDYSQAASDLAYAKMVEGELAESEASESFMEALEEQSEHWDADGDGGFTLDEFEDNLKKVRAFI